ncbi:MAG TPA: hypothetical protein VLJ86_22015 [Ramlibacter sp.]|nr:hypothetical protein [Ramlibacter sp.]
MKPAPTQGYTRGLSRLGSGDQRPSDGDKTAHVQDNKGISFTTVTAGIGKLGHAHAQNKTLEVRPLSRQGSHLQLGDLMPGQVGDESRSESRAQSDTEDNASTPKPNGIALGTHARPAKPQATSTTTTPRLTVSASSSSSSRSKADTAQQPVRNTPRYSRSPADGQFLEQQPDDKARLVDPTRTTAKRDMRSSEFRPHISIDINPPRKTPKTPQPSPALSRPSAGSSQRTLAETSRRGSAQAWPLSPEAQFADEAPFTEPDPSLNTDQEHLLNEFTEQLGNASGEHLKLQGVRDALSKALRHDLTLQALPQFTRLLDEATHQAKESTLLYYNHVARRNTSLHVLKTELQRLPGEYRHDFETVVATTWPTEVDAERRAFVINVVSSGVVPPTNMETVRAGLQAARANMKRDAVAMTVSGPGVRALIIAGFVALAASGMDEKDGNRDLVMVVGGGLAILALWLSTRRAHNLISAAWSKSTPCKRRAAKVLSAMAPVGAALTIGWSFRDGPTVARNAVASLLGRIGGAVVRDATGQLMHGGLDRNQMVGANPCDISPHVYRVIPKADAESVDLLATMVKTVIYSMVVWANYIYLVPFIKPAESDITRFGHDSTSTDFTERLYAEAAQQCSWWIVEVIDAGTGVASNAAAVALRNLYHALCHWWTASTESTPHYGMRVLDGTGACSAISRNVSGVRAGDATESPRQATAQRIRDNTAMRIYLAFVLIECMQAIKVLLGLEPASDVLRLGRVLAVGGTEVRTYLINEGTHAERMAAESLSGTSSGTLNGPVTAISGGDGFQFDRQRAETPRYVANGPAFPVDHHDDVEAEVDPYAIGGDRMDRKGGDQHG